MKQLVQLRSNLFYSETKEPVVELVVVHSNGKFYKINQEISEMEITTKIEDFRFLVNAKDLSLVITQLIELNLRINEKES